MAPIRPIPLQCRTQTPADFSPFCAVQPNPDNFEYADEDLWINNGTFVIPRLDRGIQSISRNPAVKLAPYGNTGPRDDNLQISTDLNGGRPVNSTEAGGLLLVGIVGLGVLAGGWTALAVTGLALLACSPLEKIGDPVYVERVSVGPGGVEGNWGSGIPSISADGRLVAFESDASNLVPGDTNDNSDIFVHDRQTGITERVSVDPKGSVSALSISADGRLVAFESEASNLVPGDTNNNGDIFVHDRQSGKTERVSIGTDGMEGNARSGYALSISADGRFVAFDSWASNLVPMDTNGESDIFVHDRQTGTTERVSVGPGGVEGNAASWLSSISANGRFVVFASFAFNLVPGDTNGTYDIFIHDRQTGKTERVSVGTGGTEGNGKSCWLTSPSINADGRFVAFDSWASNLVPGDTNGELDVFVRDRQPGITERVSIGTGGTEGNAWSGSSLSISADGRFVAFDSKTSNLVPGDTNGKEDVFVHDKQTGKTERVSVGPGSVEGNSGSSDSPSISADGRFVVFRSAASNLVRGDTNIREDIFVVSLEHFFGPY